MSAQTLSPSQIQSVSTPAYIFISSIFTKLNRLFSFRKAKSFGDLPDDVLLEIFTALDFQSIISLRQTCRRCHRVSKTAAVWMDAFNWITHGADDWRTSLNELLRVRSAQTLEALVSRMVRFERNWAASPPRPTRISTFPSTGGIAEELVPGGRWFLGATRDDPARILYHDLDSQDIQPRTLLTCPHRSRVVRQLAVDVPPVRRGVEFHLAVESAYQHPTAVYSQDDAERDITIWEVLHSPNEGLIAKPLRSFPIYRRTPGQSPLSLIGNSVLRLAYGMPSSARPVFTVHRWNDETESNVQCSVLIPYTHNLPNAGLVLLPDGRILAAFQDRLELYPAADRAVKWDDLSFVAEDIPPTAPQWVFRHEPPVHHIQSDRLVRHYFLANAPVAFSVHNGKTLFRFRITPDGIALPERTEADLGGMTRGQLWGLGTARAIRSSPGPTETLFPMTASDPSLIALLEFSDVSLQSLALQERLSNSENYLSIPHRSGGGSWKVDEFSGRIVSPARFRKNAAVIYFAD